MAEHLGITPSGYRKNECGENIPHLSILYRFFNEHNIAMDWFLFGKGPMHHAGPKIQAQEDRIRELESEVQRLTRELETIDANYSRDREQLQQIQDQAEGLSDLGADVKEKVDCMKNDPELYHDLMMHFHKYKKERPQRPEGLMPA